jgi:heat shock protein HtpX
MDNLFSTHPSTENRIAALEELSREMGFGGWVAGQNVGGQITARKVDARWHSSSQVTARMWPPYNAKPIYPQRQGIPLDSP